MTIPENATAVLMRGDGNKGFTFSFLTEGDELPVDAELDNYLEIDGQNYDVYCTKDAPVVGRTFALQMWAEGLE